MMSYRRDSRYIFLFVFIAVLLIVLGLVLLVILSSTVWNSTTGRKHVRAVITSTPAVASFVIVPTIVPTVVPETDPFPSAVSPIIPGAYRGLLTNGSRDEKKVALTFDLCETEGDLAGFDTDIIRILNETQTPATLFLGGLWMRDHQAETLELAGNPLFELGDHSWSHADFSAISREEMDRQILQTQQTMYDLLGYQTNLFRLPYGTYTDEALKAINEQGLYIIQWDDVSGDPDPNIDAKNMTVWVLQQVQPGSIIIMHANGRGWHTAEALPKIIGSLRKKGYSLVTISELLKIPPYK